MSTGGLSFDLKRRVASRNATSASTALIRLAKFTWCSGSKGVPGRRAQPGITKPPLIRGEPLSCLLGCDDLNPWTRGETQHPGDALAAAFEDDFYLVTRLPFANRAIEVRRGLNRASRNRNNLIVTLEP